MFVSSTIKERSLIAAQRRKTMLTKSKTALSVALVLATASVAFAAPKHAVRHVTKIERQVPAGAYLSFGAVRATGSESSNQKIQDIGFRENL
jgi:hypothetical protein